MIYFLSAWWPEKSGLLRIYHWLLLRRRNPLGTLFEKSAPHKSQNATVHLQSSGLAGCIAMKSSSKGKQCQQRAQFTWWKLLYLAGLGGHD